LRGTLEPEQKCSAEIAGRFVFNESVGMVSLSLVDELKDKTGVDAAKLNWLRAGVLGANDGIISVSVVLVSIVGVLSPGKMLLVGISAVLAGSVSMALGEYISVSAQRDAEIAAEHTEHTNPIHAAMSSFLSFLSGAIIPLVFSILFHSVMAIVIAVLVALILTTFASVYVGKSSMKKQLLRNVLGGGLALTVGVLLNTAFGAF
jgi:VIT1/CCC1 family predicted Fe2+/Mn2+ transporter